MRSPSPGLDREPATGPTGSGSARGRANRNFGRVDGRRVRVLVARRSRDAPDTVMVFDDVERCATALLDKLALLVEQAPAGIRVVLSSRSDPPLPLHRLRVRGELRRASPGRAEDVRGRRGGGDPASRPHVVDPGAGSRARAPHGRMAGGDPDGRAVARGPRTSTNSSRPSRATIATSPTTSRTRCWPANPLRSASSCSTRRCSEG